MKGVRIIAMKAIKGNNIRVIDAPSLAVIGQLRR